MGSAKGLGLKRQADRPAVSPARGTPCTVGLGPRALHGAFGHGPMFAFNLERSDPFTLLVPSLVEGSLSKGKPIARSTLPYAIHHLYETSFQQGVFSNARPKFPGRSNLPRQRQAARLTTDYLPIRSEAKILNHLRASCLHGDLTK